MSHLLLPHPLVDIRCLVDVQPFPKYISLSPSVCVIVWLETGVLESEQIPTNCNLFHNQDLYKYSVLPLPLCQIVISIQSFMLLEMFYYLRFCILLCLFPCLTLFILSLPFSRSDSRSCSPSHHPATLFWIQLTITPLDSPPDLFTLSQPSSLQPQPPHLVSHNSSNFPVLLHFISPCYNKYLGSFILVF